MRMPNATLVLALLCLAGCARTAELTPLHLKVVDAQTSQPVEAILIVRTLDPRHPLRVADMLRPEAAKRRTYPSRDGEITGTFDTTLEQAELVARGYEAQVLSLSRQNSAEPLVIRMQRAASERP